MEKLKRFLQLPKTSLLLIGFLATFAACNKTSAPAEDELLADTGRPRLRPSDIFKTDSINSFIGRYGTQNQEYSEKFYARSKQLSEKDDVKAAWNLKNALTYYPLESWYLELGDVLIRSKNFNEAQQAYAVFLNTEKKPEQEQWLNIVKAYILADENPGRYNVGARARESGITSEQFQYLLHEDDVVKRLSPNEIKDYYEYFTATSSEGDTILPDFEKFSKEFDQVTLPLRIDESGLSKHSFSEEYYDYEPSRDFSKYEYERMKDLKFYPDYDFQYSFKTGNNLIGFIYSADTSGRASTRQNRCVYHRLMMYDAAGNFLSTHVVGIQAGEQLSTYEIQKDGKIIVYNFTREWKKPYDKNSPDNELVRTVPKDTTVLSLTADGHIQ